MVARLVLPVSVVTSLLATGPACAPTTTVPDDEDTGVVDDNVDDDDTGACPEPGSGLTLEETGAFLAGDQGDGVVVLMGGAAEVDRGSARFVDGAGGGDVLVLRATGSTSSYTSYFADDLAALVTVAPRSVATIRVDDPAAGADPALLCRLRRADAVWLAGGDQSDYLVQWPDALQAGLRDAVARGAAVGGTSAGAMSWSALAFDAAGGGITSDDALQTPTSPLVSVTPSPFAAVAGVLVDTHFQARDREGRLLAFLAHARPDTVGVGIDEGTALVVDGDNAAVLADDGGSVWLYRVEGVTLTAGAALSIDAVERVSFDDGRTMAWPAPFTTPEGFVVDDGVVLSRP